MCVVVLRKRAVAEVAVLPSRPAAWAYALTQVATQATAEGAASFARAGRPARAGNASARSAATLPRSPTHKPVCASARQGLSSAVVSVAPQGRPVRVGYVLMGV